MIDKFFAHGIVGNLMVIAFCIIALLFTAKAPFKEEYKKQKIYWALFWAQTLVMHCYYIIRFIKTGQQKPGEIPDDVVFMILQPIATLVGHTSLALIFTDFGVGKFRNKIVAMTVGLTILSIAYFFANKDHGYICNVYLYGTLFLMIGYQYRLVDIDTSLALVSYAFFAYLVFLDQVTAFNFVAYKDLGASESGNPSNVLNENSFDKLRNSGPSITIIAYLAILRGTYKLVEKKQ